MASLDINWLTPYKIRELTITGGKGMFLVDYLNRDLYFYENQDALNIESERLSMFKGVSEGRMVRFPVASRSRSRRSCRHSPDPSSTIRLWPSRRKTVVRRFVVLWPWSNRAENRSRSTSNIGKRKPCM